MFAKRANLPRTATTSRNELHTEVRFGKERNITQDRNIAKKGNLAADNGVSPVREDLPHRATQPR